MDAPIPADAPANLDNRDSLNDAAYHVVLENFQGPLDLLLHLIKEQQMDIYDIPISVITRQYLRYLDLMKALNINVAGEFLVMAATLIHIKSRTLLPVTMDGTDGLDDEEGEDPREELIRRLVDYQRYKSAAGELEARADLWREFYARPGEAMPAEDDGLLLEELQLFDLVGALQRVIARLPADMPFVVTPDELSVTERMAAILDELSLRPCVDFFQLCAGARSRRFVIVTFLAVLELIRLQLMAVQAAGESELLLRRSASRDDLERTVLEEVDP
jgi:segregation and condensation protein A